MNLIQDEDDVGLLLPLKASSKTSAISNKGGKSEPVIVETGHTDPHGKAIFKLPNVESPMKSCVANFTA